MNNYSLEPKDGDFVALVKQLEKKNVAAMKNDVVKSNAKHQEHIQKEAINIQSTPQERASVLKTKNNNLNQGAKAPPQQSTYQNSNNATLGKVTNKNAVNSNKKTSPLVSFLIVACIFVFFSLIVFSDDPERLIRIFVPVFFALIFFNIFKNKPKKKQLWSKVCQIT